MPPIEKRREYQPNGDAEMAEWPCSSRAVFRMERERKRKKEERDTIYSERGTAPSGAGSRDSKVSWEPFGSW
jgi:hypothetical protein